MREPAPATERTPRPNSPENRQELILSIIGASVLLFAAVAIIVFLGLTGTGRGSAGTPTATDKKVEATSTLPASPSPMRSCETVINSGNIQVSVALPISTTVKNTQFRVEPIVPETDAWSYPSDRSGVALWVCGTVVNYVIGLDPTPEAEALITSLTPGDRIRLQLANGIVLPFRFTARQEVPPGDEDVLTQRQPRLTLLLAGEDVWQVAVADYVAEEEPAGAAASEPSAQVGQPVTAADARITVSRGHARRDESLPPGTMYYLVEFLVDNIGDTPLSTGSFSMRLRDELGNTYLASPSASETGDHGPPSGELQPGASVQATAGYLVPDPLPIGTLTWTFSPRPGSEAQARIGIPYEGPAGSPSSTGQIDVTVDDAFLSSDGAALIIVGEVRNGGTETLSVEMADITLSSSSGASELIMAAPPLPWSIEPGQAQVIELQYQRPGASAVLLELLGYSFEIAGIQ
jgi:hypothetical protein